MKRAAERPTNEHPSLEEKTALSDPQPDHSERAEPKSKISRIDIPGYFDDMLRNVRFRVEKGIRYLDPYWSSYSCFTKGRWVGRKLVDVFQEEFLSVNRFYPIVACKLGRITVNGRRMTDINYVLKDNDRISHIGHRHEHPILDQPIEIIEDNPDLLIVNKPPSLPVHPCGQYKLHTVLGLLRNEYNIEGLRVLHRLDRTTSGLLIFAKNYETDRKFKSLLSTNECRKEYVCMVDGIFPDEGREIICDQPIRTLVVSMGIQCVGENGKSAKTRFRRLWTDGKNSVVQCFLESGRTHQIRVHLQYLGYPIKDDQLYNSEVWGPNKGKDGVYGKSYDQLCKDIKDAHRCSLWHERIDPDYECRMEYMAKEKVEPEAADMPLESRPEYDSICLGCNVVKKIVPRTHFMLYLHCLKYETDDWTFSTKLPDWAINPCEKERACS
ncbi:hypothetical protein AB6A40_001103 [Gnathostoma spinigerum]|uniref:Pseudouridine synthase n=1 Tax=Gnathostoma spinigerum TaxID=75299 RepID=A0ABD6E896_9BILA